MSADPTPGPSISGAPSATSQPNAPPPSSPSAATDEYQYRPLVTSSREIRLLVNVNQDSESETAKLDLNHVSLDDRPKYCALSYVWGPPEPSTLIRLGGGLIRVRQNLFDFLNILRPYSDQSTPVWIDAICINQEDIGERNSQVQLMGDIFSDAHWVISWLGRESEDSELAFEIISCFENEVKGDGDFREIVKSEKYEKHWIALKSHLDREYWSRVWITQEIILPRSVLLLCGTDRCSWWSLAGLIGFSDTAPHPSTKPSEAASSVILTPVQLARTVAELATERSRGRNIPLSIWLSVSRQRYATDERDRVFSVLGLVRNNAEYRPDYTKTSATIFREITQHCIAQGGNLDVLSCCSFLEDEDHRLLEETHMNLWKVREKSPETYDLLVSAPQLSAGPAWPLDRTLGNKEILPSWVPNWTQRRDLSDRHSLVVNIRERRCCFQAAGDSAPDVRYLESQGKMITRGVVIDPIESASADMTDDLLEDWNLWQESTVPQDVYGDVAATRLAFKSTAVLGRDVNGYKQSFTGGSLLDEKAFGLPYDGPLGISYGQTRISREDFFDGLISRYYSRRFFVTGLGYIGRGPAALQAGDIIAVLLGGKVPFVLRGINGDGSCYVLIGECCEFSQFSLSCYILTEASHRCPWLYGR